MPLVSGYFGTAGDAMMFYTDSELNFTKKDLRPIELTLQCNPFQRSMVALWMHLCKPKWQ